MLNVINCFGKDIDRVPDHWVGIDSDFQLVLFFYLLYTNGSNEFRNIADNMVNTRVICCIDNESASARHDANRIINMAEPATLRFTRCLWPRLILIPADE